MESLKRSLKFQINNSKAFLFGFWISIILVDIAFFIINYLIPNYISIGFSLGYAEEVTRTSIVGINLMAILISFIVYNYKSNYESFPLSISLSMTRKDYFLSFLIDNIFVVFICAVLQGILLKIEPIFVRMIDRTPLYDFVYFNSETDNIFYIILVLFFIFLAYMSFWNLIASINYKFGYKIWIIYVAISILISVLNLDSIPRFIESLAKIFDSSFGILQITIILIFLIFSNILNFFIVNKTDIKKSIL